MPRMRMPTRQAWVRLHRWAGLLTAAFLCVAGLTGAILAFEPELDAWLNPALLRVQAPTEGAAYLDPFTLRERVQAQLDGVRVDHVPLRRESGHAVALRLNPDPTGPTVTHAYADPYTGRVLGTRNEGEISLARPALLPLIYRIHCELALPGIWGRLLFGLIALVWTLDCLVGLYLTLPTRGAARAGFWQGWRPAWLIKRGASAPRLTLDIHRAFALWLWLPLLVYAWSSVMFNLRDQVYHPVMSQFLPFDTSWRTAPPLERPLQHPALDWRQAHAAARAAMAQLAREHGLAIDGEESLALDRRRGLYAYMVHSNADLRSQVGNTAILIDATHGQRRGSYLPTRGAAGNTFSNWLGALHMAHVFGLPYRIFASLLGLVVVALSVTGVMIWLNKRKGRRHARVRVRGPA
ncbi:PepSY domain protein [Bordetella bronchiseptica SBL-F6116]|nr:PepSY domain protein [Bordetella bronchiseptica 00-P-2730]KDE01247.1 PepSY domain protein [Bordetella bronchiseptica SBL-F6116]